MSILYSILITCGLSTVGEYIMHRFFMHRRGSYYYHSHHIEHHALDMNAQEHMGVSQNFWLIWFASLPLTLLFSWLLTPYYIIIHSAFLIWWLYSWEYVHRAIHNEPKYLWGKYLLPWFSLAKRHHLNHHIKTTTNFGAMFIWSDYLFRTSYNDKTK